MKKINQILLVVILGAISGVASATQITGVIKFGGDLTYDLNANTVDILGDDAVVLTDPTGSFSSISKYSVATYNDFTYDPFVTVSPLWSIGGFSFALNQITYIDESDGFLDLAGMGVFSGNGYDDTVGAWTFSANGVGGGEFAFSSVNAPEPGIALLLGAGLIGLGVSRKLRKA